MNPFHAKFLQKTERVTNNEEYVDKIGTQNVLFVGGCRSFVFNMMFEELTKHVPQFESFGYGALAVHIPINVQKFTGPTEKMKQAFENADYIVCEQVRTYSYLNTSPKCEESIFKSFNIKDSCKILQIPNSEIVYFYNDILNHYAYSQQEINGLTDEKSVENIVTIKNHNLKRLVDHCIKYEFPLLAEFIQQNIHKVRLFNVINHPNNCVMAKQFEEMIGKLFGYQLDDCMLNVLSSIRVFDDDKGTQMVEMDYQTGFDRNVV